MRHNNQNDLFNKSFRFDERTEQTVLARISKTTPKEVQFSMNGHVGFYTSLSGTHWGSSNENGLLKAPFSGTMRSPLGLRTSFLPSGTADIFPFHSLSVYASSTTVNLASSPARLDPKSRRTPYIDSLYKTSLCSFCTLCSALVY